MTAARTATEPWWIRLVHQVAFGGVTTSVTISYSLRR